MQFVSARGDVACLEAACLTSAVQVLLKSGKLQSPTEAARDMLKALRDAPLVKISAEQECALMLSVSHFALCMPERLSRGCTRRSTPR